MLYKYRKIDLEQFAVLTDTAVDPNTEIEFHIDLEFGYDRDNMVLANKMTLNATAGDTTLMKAIMTSYFEISPESIAEASDENGKISFDPMTLVQFASLNYGSLRGALYVKTADTTMKNVVIPPFFFHKIITSAFVIE